MMNPKKQISALALSSIQCGIVFVGVIIGFGLKLLLGVVFSESFTSFIFLLIFLFSFWVRWYFVHWVNDNYIINTLGKGEIQDNYSMPLLTTLTIIITVIMIPFIAKNFFMALSDLGEFLTSFYLF